MSRAALLTLGAVAAGFALGFLYGGRVRDELPGATEVDYSGGRVTVAVDVNRALSDALGGLLR